MTIYQHRRQVISTVPSVANSNSRPVYSTDPQAALDEFHADQRVLEEQIEAERLDERLREQGWSEAAIRDRGRDDKKHPLCGVVEAYYEGSLKPVRVEYLHGETTARRPGLAAPRIRFPWWRGAVSK
jgi:hypothetical protein